MNVQESVGTQSACRFDHSHYRRSGMKQALEGFRPAREDWRRDMGLRFHLQQC